jgi:glycosyltransferase involved in cell wall biosynthesis
MIDPRQPDFCNTPVSPNRPIFGYAPADPTAPPAVTILTPFHNTREVFHETAACVLGQSFQQFEWLVINDGSSDERALAVLNQYRQRDPRIRIIDFPDNRGVVASRNAGFAAARSPYVFQLDDDDLIEPTAIEKLYWYLESHPEHAVVSSWTIGFDGQQYLWQRGFERGAEFLDENQVTAMALMRRATHAAMGGYDERMRGGLEDWEFWLRLAAHGHWGGTVPEYLGWYRRRTDHSDRWAHLSCEQQAQFRAEFTQRYAGLRDAFPKSTPQDAVPFARLRDELVRVNPLARAKRRLLLVVPWMTLGGADKFNLDLVRQLTAVGWEITVAATHCGDNCWLPEFTRFTPDAFALPCFLKPAERAVFLRYLIASRQPEVVLLSNSELAYQLLPYLRATAPEPVYVDYCHMEEDEIGGGYPRYAVAYQPQLDLNLVSSAHLKRWMLARGAAAERIEVATTNIDPELWSPDRQKRAGERQRQGVSEQQVVLLYAGRLCPQKQPRVFAQTMAALVTRGCVFQAWVAGDGEDGPWLESFVREHNLLDRVHLLGPQSLDRMRALMAASDIFFMPSAWEGIALTIYEAMACGLTVVGAAVGGQAELVTPECGYLIERSDEQQEVERYAGILASLIGDPQELTRRGVAARARIVEHFTLRHFRARVLELLARAASLKQDAPRCAYEASAAHEAAVQAIEQVRLGELLDGAYAQVLGLTATRNELSNEVTRVSQARDWFHAEAYKWERESQQRMTAINELQATITQLRSWIQQVEAARDWHNAERARLDALVQDLQSRLEGTQKELARVCDLCETWKRQYPFRVLRRARILRDLNLNENGAD